MAPDAGRPSQAGPAPAGRGQSGKGQGAGQGGTGQSGTGQSGQGQSGTGQSAQGQSGKGQNGRRQNGTGQNGTGQNGQGGQNGPGQGSARRSGTGQAATRPATARHAAADQDAASQDATRAAAKNPVRDTGAAKQPWYEIAHSNRTAAGRRHCGRLEEVVRREWAPDAAPPPEAVAAIDRLAELPQLIKKKLAAGLDAIHVGPGGVPDLDDMSRLSGVPLPSGRATWDACAGAYGERKIIVGSRPSPSPDVMCHEIGHALDDIDGTDDQWQSDSAEFRALYDRCLPHMISDFHRQRGVLGRREFFADAFAAIASRQRPALVDMVGGDTRAALDVMLYFNVRYGI
jgi:hypothetical protein